LPRSSSADGLALLVAAVSGRALAQAARRAGFVPLVADFFADMDTQEAAYACCKLDDIARGFRWASLARALDALAAASPAPILGFVYGSGFEDRPELLSRIAERWTLIGNDAATVRRLKDPKSFFSTLDRLGIAHPATTCVRPARGVKDWLVKREGGAGGSHIGIDRSARKRGNRYYQERVEGSPVSALFLADGTCARVLGFSEQWPAPSKGRPFRYGGAVRPARLTPSAKEAMRSAVERAVSAFGIRGLASADFMVKGKTALLLEINPRPGATIDIFDSADAPLLKLHLEAAQRDKLPRQAPRPAGAAASAIVFARRRLAVPLTMAWPVWTADRAKPGEIIDKERPICTVWARAGTTARAKSLVEARTKTVLACIESKCRGDYREQNGQKDGSERRRGGPAERQHRGRADRQVNDGRGAVASR